MAVGPVCLQFLKYLKYIESHIHVHVYKQSVKQKTKTIKIFKRKATPTTAIIIKSENINVMHS